MEETQLGAQSLPATPEEGRVAARIHWVLLRCQDSDSAGLGRSHPCGPLELREKDTDLKKHWANNSPSSMEVMFEEAYHYSNLGEQDE